ncbi:MAG TPA: MaoC family dehydratase [Candidatus Binataceae bacterium]|nr:MaoC family dehydratase [Candidatus Binataceae bacterium]
MAETANGSARAAAQSLTARDNYFEDFNVGDVFEHARGKTVGEIDNVLITNLVMNTAQAHFNEHSMRSNPIGHRITFGGVTASLVIGLAMQDTGEQALAELGLDKIRFRTPVLHGDTLYAFSEVLEKRDFDGAAAGRRELAHYGPSEAGEVRFRHWGVNDRGELVFEGERRVLLKRRGFGPRASAPAKPARSRAGGRAAASARQKPTARRARVARASAAAKKSGTRPRRRR